MVPKKKSETDHLMSSDHSCALILGDTGYERVKDWRERGPGGVSTPVAVEDGYERVPSFKSRLKRKDSEAGPGYETVPPALPPSGPSRSDH